MKRWIWILLIVVGIGILGWAIYERYFAPKNKVEDLQGDGQGAIRAAGRNFDWLNNNSGNILPQTGNTGILGFLDGGQNLVQKRYKPLLSGSADEFSASKRAENLKIMRNLVTQYDKYITVWGQRYRVPKVLFYTVLAIESGPYHKTLPARKPIISGNRSSFGPAQFQPTTASDTVLVGIKKGFITREEGQAFLTKQISPATAKALVSHSVHQRDTAPTIASSDLQKDELSIYLLALKLSIQFDNWGSTQDKMHLALFTYTVGDKRLNNSESPDYNLHRTTNNVSDFYAKAKSKQGKDYLLKTFGENGTLDIAINDLGIADRLS